MRANLLDDDDEARARKQAMSNLGLLMASGNAGALGSISPDVLPMLLRLLHRLQRRFSAPVRGRHKRLEGPAWTRSPPVRGDPLAGRSRLSRGAP